MLRAVALEDGGEVRHVHGLAQPEVRQLHVPPGVQQQVVRLYIPVRPRDPLYPCAPPRPNASEADRRLLRSLPTAGCCTGLLLSSTDADANRAAHSRAGLPGNDLRGDRDATCRHQYRPRRGEGGAGGVTDECSCGGGWTPGPGPSPRCRTASSPR